MDILIFHGYLLRGTGSNVYNASLAAALARLGHRVHLLCQDRESPESTFATRRNPAPSGGFRPGGEATAGGPVPESGAVTVYRPDIGRILPVYVADHYEGFDAKPFPELSDSELDHYIAANVAAVSDVAERSNPQAALANHLVMGPAILARAGLPFAAKIHGSALEYTVKPNPRFMPYAKEGMRAARGVLVGSRHTAESLWGALDDPALALKTRLGPPGVDAELFAPRPEAQAVEATIELASRLEQQDSSGGFGRDPAVGPALREWADATGPRAIFVGKLITEKGVDLLLRAWAAVHAAHPGARLLLAGFGEDRAEMERLADELSLREAVSFCGRLEHEEVATVVPAATAMVVPSVFPEAFGMVAAEAAACGVLPVCADHSGLREVVRPLAEAVGPDVAPLLSFPVDDQAVAAIAERLNRWLEMGEPERERARRCLTATVRARWSWETVAAGVIAAAEGRLGELPVVA